MGGQLEPGYISSVPYAEPSAWQGQKSPYYKETHYKFRKALREFFEKEIYPDAMRMNPMDECPDDAMHEKLGCPRHSFTSYMLAFSRVANISMLLTVYHQNISHII